jgi:hypothetical protein
MACFLVPVGEAIVTTVVQKVVEKRENKTGVTKTSNTGLTWSRRLGWLNKMLWGGALMLAIDHIIGGEIIARPPFLTALQNPGDTAVMLREMATVGVAMAAAVTLVWGIMVLIAEVKSRITPKTKTQPIN